MYAVISLPNHIMHMQTSAEVRITYAWCMHGSLYSPPSRHANQPPQTKSLKHSTPSCFRIYANTMGATWLGAVLFLKQGNSLVSQLLLEGPGT